MYSLGQYSTSISCLIPNSIVLKWTGLFFIKVSYTRSFVVTEIDQISIDSNSNLDIIETFA